MIPRLNSAKARSPAIGFNASAASAAVVMSVLPLCVQSGRRTHHDGDRNDIGDGHAGESIDPNAPELLRRLSRPLFKRTSIGVLLNLFDLLTALPEHQVRADRRAEDSDDHSQAIGGESDFGGNQTRNRRVPIDFCYEHDGDVRKENEGQPFQVLRVALIRNEQL